MAVATLNMLARKFKLKIHAQELTEEESKTESNSSANTHSNSSTTKAQPSDPAIPHQDHQQVSSPES